MREYGTGPSALFLTIKTNWHLAYVLAKRDVIGRYKGSLLGLFWSFLNPVFMLSVYTFFFSVIFKARWPGGSESRTEFALILFSGLLIFNFFAECVSRAPTLITSNVNYVKKVVFPLEIIPVSQAMSALFHAAVSFLVWIMFYLVFFGVPGPSAFLLIFVFIPLIFISLGMMWLVSAIGVYVRDIGQLVSAIIPALMLLSPIFYPASALPNEFKILFNLNPLTYLIEEARNVLLSGSGIDWNTWCLATATSLIFALLGFAWFQKTRKGFADVL